jgi:hypothetical protein
MGGSKQKESAENDFYYSGHSLNSSHREDRRGPPKSDGDILRKKSIPTPITQVYVRKTQSLMAAKGLATIRNRES